MFIDLLQFIWHWYWIVAAVSGLLAIPLAFLTPKPPREQDERLIYRS